MDDKVEEAARAEWMAIISECMESGMLDLCPPPVLVPSNRTNVLLGPGSCCLGLGFDFCFFNFSLNSAIAGPSGVAFAMRPCFSAPPLKPGR